MLTSVFYSHFFHFKNDISGVRINLSTTFSFWLSVFDSNRDAFAMRLSSFVKFMVLIIQVHYVVSQGGHRNGK